MASNLNAHSREPWNKGKIVGQKAPFRDHTGYTRSCAEAIDRFT